jgi:hypothetical protein
MAALLLALSMTTSVAADAEACAVSLQTDTVADKAWSDLCSSPILDLKDLPDISYDPCNYNLALGDDLLCGDGSGGNPKDCAKYLKAMCDQVDCAIGGDGCGSTPETGPCGLLVCASAFASAQVYYCTPGSVSLWCWDGKGSGSAYGALGAVTGTLQGAANTVPLADACFSDIVTVYCPVSDGAYEYPGTTVFVSVTVTATTAYGTHSDYDWASASI